MEEEIYLDNSATTRVFPEAAQLMSQIYLNEYGNPSSMHHKGVEAEQRIEEAKKIFAGILKCDKKNIVFTSCGSESDNLAIIGGALANCRRGKHLITTNIEHPGVEEAMHYLETQGYEVTRLPVDGNGIVTAQQVADAIRPDTILVSIMHTNNEIGALEPIEEIGAAIKAKDPAILFHVDAVQGFGKAVINPKKMHIDLLAASGHKVHGPKGIAILYIADKVKLQPLLFGGGQQRGMRSGTENVAGIAGMACASAILYEHLEEDRERLYAMKESFINRVGAIEGVSFNGKTGRESAPHIISVSVSGVRAEVLLHALEEKKVYVSSGSACATNRPHLSETLAAIGTPKELMDSTIRVSMSVMTTQEQMDAAAEAMEQIVPFLRKYTRH